MAENYNEQIDVESISLSELLQKELAVPEYQRPYVWTEKNIASLLLQIKIHINRDEADKPMFYLGSIVLHNDGEKFNIIDGQQRITTLALVSFLLNETEFSLTYDNLISQQTIIANYSYLKSQLEFLQCIDFNYINVTVITTKKEDDAYSFFETLNTGGKRLSGIDIIKAHHLRSVKSSEMNNYARSWEKEHQHIAAVVKLLLKARKWNFLRNGKVPSRRSQMNEWKEAIIQEFSSKTLKDNLDIAYSSWKNEDNMMQRLGNKYAVRQPLYDGRNFINYLLSHIDLYKELFIAEEGSTKDFYWELNDEIINRIDGTIDLQSMYQLVLFCYASRFGTVRIREASLWIFRYVYSLRVSVPNQVMEVTVKNHIHIEEKIIDKILTLHTEEDVLFVLKSYKYKVNKDNTGGVKGRFVSRTASLFEFSVDENTFSEFDIRLKQKIENYPILN